MQLSHHLSQSCQRGRGKLLLTDAWRLTVQKLFTIRLKILSITTNITALILALKPTTTITQATKPRILTSILPKFHSPAKTNPTKRKINNTLPASWKYIFRSLSSICGSPAGANFWRTHESESTIINPPITDRLRRKKLRSNIRPYPRAWVMTTPTRPTTACSLYLRMMTRVEHEIMAMTLPVRKRWVRPRGTVKSKEVALEAYTLGSLREDIVDLLCW